MIREFSTTGPGRDPFPACLGALLLFLGIAAWSAHCPAAQGSVVCSAALHVHKEWKQLVCRLDADGFEPEEIARIFSDPAISFDFRVMPRKLTHNENNLYYDRFLKKDRIARAKAFLKKHNELLKKVEQTYGVPKEVIVSILLVETDLGRYLGAGPAVRILASMAISDSPEMVNRYLPPELRGKKKTLARMKKKAGWAYDELKELIHYSMNNGLDILKIKGSIFGAIGICQFMPSNANKLGVDFDGDGRVDLFSLPDAVASTANYLTHHGWKDSTDSKEQYRVILRYNYSRPYTQTILKVADTLKTT